MAMAKDYAEKYIDRYRKVAENAYIDGMMDAMKFMRDKLSELWKQYWSPTEGLFWMLSRSASGTTWRDKEGKVYRDNEIEIIEYQGG